METSIGSFDAKTHLSEYLERARRGESFVITRRGEPLAHLGPCTDPHEALHAALGECAALRRRLATGPRFSAALLVREDRDRDDARADE